MKSLLVTAICLAATVTVLGATAREPITILSDNEFTEDNGVVAGAGTVDDPYVISGWKIEVPADQEFGIRIEGTKKSFVIEACTITGARDEDGAAIYFHDVVEGSIVDVMVQDSRNGLKLSSSQDITVRNTNLAVGRVGLEVVGATAEEFRHAIDQSTMVNGKPVLYYYGLDDELLELEDIDAGHITLAGSREVTVRGATVEHGDGMKIAFSENVVVEEADLHANRQTGLSVVSSPRTVVRDTERIASNGGRGDAGISLWLSDRSIVENVGLYANHTGLRISASDRVEARNNVYAGNQVGVWIDGAAREVDIVGGLAYGGNYGVNLESARGARLQGLAISDLEIAVAVDEQASHSIIRDCTMVDVGYGLYIKSSQNTVERNLIARADIAILFPEMYGERIARENVIRHNVLHRSAEGLYLARDTRDTRIYENAFWDCSLNVRDRGDNAWGRDGRGNWYSDYEGVEVGDTGVGDEPKDLGGGVEDEAPLVELGFLPGPPGVLGTLEEDKFVLEDDEGRSAELSALVADTIHARFIRLQGVPQELAQNMALLSRWEVDVASRFRTEHIFISLDVLYFSSDGDYIGSNFMEADDDTAHRPPAEYRMALEIPSGFLEELGLSEPVRLLP